MKRGCFALVLGLITACGGSKAPAAPSVAAPTISTPNTTIYIGQTVQFTATGGGTITWGGDAPGVARVDAPTGRVTGVGNGRETIWAENAGGRTTRALRGLPSYAGDWGGTYAVLGCQDNGDLRAFGFCGNFSNGEILNISLHINQTDDRVTDGQFALGSNQGTLNPSAVGEGGELPITGTSTGDVTIHIQNARLESLTAGTITGTFDQSWSVNGANGFALIVCSIRNLTRSSGGPTFTLLARPSANSSLEEVIRRVLQRY